LLLVLPRYLALGIKVNPTVIGILEHLEERT
jgi:hypothetical protein